MQVILPSDGPAVKVIHVGTFGVPPGITVTISGSFPLIIVADCMAGGCGVTSEVGSFDGGAVVSAQSFSDLPEPSALSLLLAAVLFSFLTMRRTGVV